MFYWLWHPHRSKLGNSYISITQSYQDLIKQTGITLSLEDEKEFHKLISLVLEAGRLFLAHAQCDEKYSGMSKRDAWLDGSKQIAGSRRETLKNQLAKNLPLVLIACLEALTLISTGDPEMAKAFDKEIKSRVVEQLRFYSKEFRAVLDSINQINSEDATFPQDSGKDASENVSEEVDLEEGIAPPPASKTKFTIKTIDDFMTFKQCFAWMQTYFTRGQEVFGGGFKYVLTPLFGVFACASTIFAAGYFGLSWAIYVPLLLSVGNCVANTAIWGETLKKFGLGVADLKHLVKTEGYLKGTKTFAVDIFKGMGALQICVLFVLGGASLVPAFVGYGPLSASAVAEIMTWLGRLSGASPHVLAILGGTGASVGYVFSAGVYGAGFLFTSTIVVGKFNSQTFAKDYGIPESLLGRLCFIGGFLALVGVSFAGGTLTLTAGFDGLLKMPQYFHADFYNASSSSMASSFISSPFSSSVATASNYLWGLLMAGGLSMFYAKTSAEACSLPKNFKNILKICFGAGPKKVRTYWYVSLLAIVTILNPIANGLISGSSAEILAVGLLMGAIPSFLAGMLHIIDLQAADLKLFRQSLMKYVIPYCEANGFAGVAEDFRAELDALFRERVSESVSPKSEVSSYDRMKEFLCCGKSAPPVEFDDRTLLLEGSGASNSANPRDGLLVYGGRQGDFGSQEEKQHGCC